MKRDTQTLIASLVDDLKPVRPYRFARGIAAVWAAAAATVLLALVMHPVRADVAAGNPSAMFLVSTGMFLLLGAACAAAAVAMASPRVGSDRNGWGWAVAMAGVLPASALTLFAIGDPAALPASQPGYGIICFGGALMMGAATAAVLVAWLRRGAPASPERAGLLTGIAAGAVGTFAFSLGCAIDALAHVGIWHVLPISVCALAGRLIVPRLVRW